MISRGSISSENKFVEKEILIEYFFHYIKKPRLYRGEDVKSRAKKNFEALESRVKFLFQR